MSKNMSKAAAIIAWCHCVAATVMAAVCLASLAVYKSDKDKNQDALYSSLRFSFIKEKDFDWVAAILIFAAVFFIACLVTNILLLVALRYKNTRLILPWLAFQMAKVIVLILGPFLFLCLTFNDFEGDNFWHIFIMIVPICLGLVSLYLWRVVRNAKVQMDNDNQ